MNYFQNQQKAGELWTLFGRTLKEPFREIPNQASVSFVFAPELQLFYSLKLI